MGSETVPGWGVVGWCALFMGREGVVVAQLGIRDYK